MRNKVTTSGVMALCVYIMFLVISAFGVMVAAVGIILGLSKEYNLSVISKIAAMPFYWTAVLALSILLFVSWAGDNYNKK